LWRGTVFNPTKQLNLPEHLSGNNTQALPGSPTQPNPLKLKELNAELSFFSGARLTIWALVLKNTALI
jgi:hypothetical protein